VGRRNRPWERGEGGAQIVSPCTPKAHVDVEKGRKGILQERGSGWGKQKKKKTPLTFDRVLGIKKRQGRRGREVKKKVRQSEPGEGPEKKKGGGI